ncbi:hypothetical protein [Haladaptatus sp. NG-SE-30]
MAHRYSGSNNGLPESIAEELAILDDVTLREVIDYAQTLLDERLPPKVLIETAAEEEIVSISDRFGYTLITKTQPCADGCADCPHGPYLYRVRIEGSVVGGNPALHWSFLGRVEA